MYKEVIKNDNSKLVFVIIFFGVILIAFTQYLFKDIQYFRWVFDIFTVSLVAFMIYRTIKHNMLEYEYYITDEGLIFQKAVGSRVTESISVNFRNIISISEMSKEDFNEKNFSKKTKCNFGLDRGEKYILYYMCGEIKNELIFTPSTAFLKFLISCEIDNKSILPF